MSKKRKKINYSFEWSVNSPMIIIVGYCELRFLFDNMILVSKNVKDTVLYEIENLRNFKKDHFLDIESYICHMLEEVKHDKGILVIPPDPIILICKNKTTKLKHKIRFYLYSLLMNYFKPNINYNKAITILENEMVNCVKKSISSSNSKYVFRYLLRYIYGVGSEAGVPYLRIFIQRLIKNNLDINKIDKEFFRSFFGYPVIKQFKYQKFWEYLKRKHFRDLFKKITELL